MYTKLDNSKPSQTRWWMSTRPTRRKGWFQYRMTESCLNLTIMNAQSRNRYLVAAEQIVHTVPSRVRVLGYKTTASGGNYWSVIICLCMLGLSTNRSCQLWPAWTFVKAVGLNFIRFMAVDRVYLRSLNWSLTKTRSTNDHVNLIFFVVV